MGGTSGGLSAASAAVTSFLGADGATGWIDRIRLVNEMVARHAAAIGTPGAGTTLIGLVVEPQRAVIVSVGDSRVYRLRDGVLQQLTTDHNIRTLRELGEPVTDGPGRALTSYIGSPDPCQRVDVTTHGLVPGDRFLLCTDGIHTQMTRSEVTTTLSEGSAEEAAIALTLAADAAGGRDNATAMIVDIANG
jgi:serine/threonine protein phosphatase PrpC